MNLQEFFEVAPWVVLTSVVTWASQSYVYRDKKKEKKAELNASVDMHRDDLAIKLMRAANEEVQLVRQEIAEIREENKALRSLEEHFYHFQQALEHLEAILTSENPASKADAERNAKAFLARMQRLQKAKSTIQHEMQVIESNSRLEERDGI